MAAKPFIRSTFEKTKLFRNVSIYIHLRGNGFNLNPKCHQLALHLYAQFVI